MKRLIPLASLALAAAAAACAPSAPAPVGPQPIVFSTEAFAWSAVTGTAAIEGRVAYAGGGRSWRCAGSVGLTPETPWTRQRFMTLYGSAERAALPAAVIRARTVAEASADYQAYVRSTSCDAQGRFEFRDLPDGDWFVIAPVTAEGADPVVVMRRVTTRAGRDTSVTLD